jgi:hypothetical protein
MELIRSMPSTRSYGTRPRQRRSPPAPCQHHASCAPPRPYGRLAAFVDALLLCGLDARPLALPNEPALHLRHHAQHGHQNVAGVALLAVSEVSYRPHSFPCVYLIHKVPDQLTPELPVTVGTCPPDSPGALTFYSGCGKVGPLSERSPALVPSGAQSAWIVPRGMWSGPWDQTHIRFRGGPA